MAVVLLTGARGWPEQDISALARAFSEHLRRGDTLLHGGAPGVDAWGAAMWERFGPVREFPARDFDSPLQRNLYMISLQPDKCLAFAMKWRSGTGHCARHARKAGIKTFDFGVDTRIEVRG